MSSKLTGKSLLVLALLSLTTLAARCIVSDPVGVSTIEPRATSESQVADTAIWPQAGLEFEGLVVPQQVVQLAFSSGGTLAEIAAAEGKQVETGGEIARSDTTMLELSLQQIQADLASAEAELARVEASVSSQNLTAAEQATLAVAQAAVTRVQAALAAAQLALDRATLTAPFDGTVAQILVKPGEFVAAGQPVVVFASLTHLVVKVEFDEWSIVSLKEDQKVNVRVLALDNAILPGQISAVSKMPIFKPGGETVYKALITLDTTEERLAWGMTVEVELLP